MTTTPVAISSSVRARSGNSRRAPSSLSTPLGCGRTESPYTELRLFLAQLFLPKERIWFHPLMCEEIVNRYLADPDAMTRLQERHLVSDRITRRSRQIVHHPLCAPGPWSTTLQSRRFDSVIARLEGLNQLGYHIRICHNPLSFGRRCEQTVRGVRSVVLAGGGRNKPLWLDWLSHHRQDALVAVDSGNAVQINLRIPPIRNPRCIQKWQYLPDPDDDTTIEWPQFDDIADSIEALAKSDGLNPSQI